MIFKTQNHKKLSKITKSGLLKFIGAFFLIILVAFIGGKLNYQAKINQTLKELDDPMISKDLLGLELEEQYVSPESEWMKGKYTGPYIVNYFTKTPGKSDIEILDEIIALAEKNGWKIIEVVKDEERTSLYAEKNLLKLFVRVAEQSTSSVSDSGSNSKTNSLRLAIQRPTRL